MGADREKHKFVLDNFGWLSAARREQRWAIWGAWGWLQDSQRKAFLVTFANCVVQVLHLLFPLLVLDHHGTTALSNNFALTT